MIERQRPPGHQPCIRISNMAKGNMEYSTILLDAPLSLATDFDRGANDLMPVANQPMWPNPLGMATYPTQHG